MPFLAGSRHKTHQMIQETQGIYTTFIIIFLILISLTVFATSGTGGTTYNLDGNTIHRFDTNGTFTVTSGGNIKILIIGGGGAGAEGGGGAGGLIYNGSFAVTPQSYTVIVGAGSTIDGNQDRNGGTGSHSIFATLDANGGGGGGANISAGLKGGSGGGAGAGGNFGKNGGLAQAGQGNVGGTTGGAYATNLYPSSGGGGAGSAANNVSNNSISTSGGIGLQYDINGTMMYYAGGGGGANYFTGGANGSGGLGGGGTAIDSSNGNNGLAGTGGGGAGAGGTYYGGNGGNGIIIIQYITPPTHPPQDKIDLNVVYDSNSHYVNAWNLDCNDNTFDANAVNTVYSVTTDINTHLICNIDKPGFQSLVNQLIVFDTNKTSTYRLVDNNLDGNAPVTTLTKTFYSDTNIAQIHLTCTDPGSGCALTQYRIDGNSVWQTFLTDVNYVNLGHHTIDFNSKDNVGNQETTNSQDLNMPVKLTILYPKDIQTLSNIPTTWGLRSTGGIILNLTGLNSDQNHYIQANTLTTFYIVDTNNNYSQAIYTKTYYSDSNTGYDTLQPYLYAISTSLTTILNAINAQTNQPIPNITFKVYGNLPGIGNTLIGQVTTDSKGQALQLFILGQNYTIDAYTGSTLIKSFNITATSTSIYFILDLGQTTIGNPTTSGYSATWTPKNTLTKSNIGTQAFTQTLLDFNSTNKNITSTITQNGSNLVAPQTYTGTSSSKAFNYLINWSDINAGTIIQTLTVTAPDGNVYTFTNNLIVTTSYGMNYNQITGLQTGMRTDMQCSSNPLIPCYPLLIIAVLLCIGLAIYASVAMGQFGSQSAGLVFLIGMILFTFLTWIPVWLTAGLVLIILAFIVNERRQ